MENSIYENWDGHHVKLTWFPQKVLQECNHVTSVHGYCFYKGKILLAEIKGRGFNIPGGHVETEETLVEAFQREALEEGYVKGKIRYLGAIEVSHEENRLFDPNGRYPIVGYQLFFRMDVTECLEFLGEHESASRIWVHPDKVPEVMNDHKLALLVLQEAINIEKNQLGAEML